MAIFRQNGRTELRDKLTERSAEPVRSILAERSAEPFGFGRTLEEAYTIFQQKFYGILWRKKK